MNHFDLEFWNFWSSQRFVSQIIFCHMQYFVIYDVFFEKTHNIDLRIGSFVDISYKHLLFWSL